MFHYFKKGLQLSLTNFLLFLAIILAILVVWQIFWVTYTPNLLTNSGFETNQVDRWKTASRGNVNTTPKQVINEANNNVVVLEIPDTSEASWVGIGQQIPIEPERPYKASLNYRLAQASGSAAKVILRVLQRDETGAIIKTDEIPSPDFLDANATEGTHHPLWNTLTYAFTTEKNVVSVEIGGGLYGQQATTVEIDNIILEANPMFLSTIWRSSVIKILALLIVLGTVYKLEHRLFAWISIKTPTIRVNRRLIVIIAVNIITFFVFAELAALGIYFFRDGKFFYTNKKQYTLIQKENDNEEVTQRRIHPYFGYVERPGVIRKSTHRRWRVVKTRQQNINNQGFISRVDYPFSKNNENQYIIGIVGGSVAEVFAIVGKDKLIEQLQQDEFFRDKEIIVLNFAKGAYKQPQQLLVIAYFLAIGQEFDMVINIDGFNEVTLGERNNEANFDISMPTKSIMKGLSKLTNQLTTQEVESLAKIKRYETQLDNLAQTLNNNNIASVNFVLEQYYTYILKQYGEEIKRFNALESSSFSDNSVLFMKPSDMNLEDQILFEEIADMWVESSIGIHHLLSSRGIVYIHLLQPNQYYSNKPFSDEEAALALNDIYSFKDATERGYPVLVANIEQLRSQNVNFYNGISMFDNEPRLVYIDECCHLTQLGNDLMAEFIANSTLEAINSPTDKQQD